LQKLNELTRILPEKSFNVFDNPIYTSSESIMSDGNMSEKRSFRYVYMPPYYGDGTSKFLIEKTGYSITLELTKVKAEWKIANLEISNNYLAPNFNVYAYFNTLMQGSDSCHVNFRIQKPDKSMLGYLLVRKENQKLLSAFQKINYLKEGDFQPTKNPTTAIYSFAVYKKVPIPGSIWGDAESLMILELIFLDDNSNRCLISIGKSYAFYKMEDLDKIKKYISNELKTAAL
jgi:hypothetical protein